MSKDSRKCVICSKLYEKGFFGTGFKFCSNPCREESKRLKMKAWYKRTHPIDTKKKCILCKRSISIVGKRKNFAKYCSTLCMERGSRIRQRGSKYIYIKIFNFCS